MEVINNLFGNNITHCNIVGNSASRWQSIIKNETHGGLIVFDTTLNPWELLPNFLWVNVICIVITTEKRSITLIYINHLPHN